MPAVIDPQLVAIINQRVAAALQALRRNAGNTAWEAATGVWTDQSYASPGWLTSVSHSIVSGLGSAALQNSSAFDAAGAAAAAQAASDPLGAAAAVSLTSLGGTAPTGTGAVVRATSPVLVTPALGTPASGNLANCSGYPSGNLTGVITSVGLATSIASQTGTGSKFVVDTDPTLQSPTFVTPALGTPASGVLTSCTGLTEAGLTLSDVTTANVSTTEHGFAPKAPNDATKYLDGTGTYSVPVGSVSLSGTNSWTGLNTFSDGISSPGTGGAGKNEFFGVNAGKTVSTNGGFNTCVGYAAGQNISNASTNVFIGYNCAADNTLGTAVTQNVIIGYSACYNLSGSATQNTVVGASPVSGLTGSQNVVVGYGAGGSTLTSGSHNTLIGQGTDVSASGATYQTVIGAGAVGTANNQVTLGRTSDQVYIPGSQLISQGATGTIAATIAGIASRTTPLLQLQTSAASLGNVGSCKFDHFATVSTTHTNGTYDTLYSDTTIANTLAINGDKIVFDYSGTIVSSATATREFLLTFAGITIFDSGALTFTSSGTWRMEGYIMRVTSTTALSVVTFTQTGSTGSQVLQTLTPPATLTGLTLTTTNALVLTAAAAGTGAASGDISATSGTISNIPAGS